MFFSCQVGILTRPTCKVDQINMSIVYLPTSKNCSHLNFLFFYFFYKWIDFDFYINRFFINTKGNVTSCCNRWTILVSLPLCASLLIQSPSLWTMQVSRANTLFVAAPVGEQGWIHKPSIQDRPQPDTGCSETSHHCLLLQVSQPNWIVSRRSLHFLSHSCCIIVMLLSKLAQRWQSALQ